MSTGMGDIKEVELAVSKFNREQINILHCVSDYPLDPNNAALKNITVLQETFPNHNIGFSDHSLGHELTLCSLALGAKVIEKHITLDRNDPELAEHHFSLEPKELKEMVYWIRAMDKNLASNSWTRSPEESEGKRKFRRSYHYKMDLPKGHSVSLNDLVFIRPGEGADHKDIEKIVGKPLNRDIEAYSPCVLNDVR
jgi:sialic acid synthase SpsE